jgi:predicted RNase H-like HicB family nuclease
MVEIANAGLGAVVGQSVMLSSYIRAAMRHARYEIVEDDCSFYGAIPSISGVWTGAKTLEGCREGLERVLEGWVLLSIADHTPIPEIDGNRIESREAVAEKVSALQTAAYFTDRQARADFKAFDKIMRRRGGSKPREGDEMPSRTQGGLD